MQPWFRRVFVASTVVLTMLVLPAVAAAADGVSVSGDTLNVIVTDGVDHYVSVTNNDPNTYTIHEGGTGPVLPAPGPGCTDLGAGSTPNITYRCTSMVTIATVNVTMGAGVDHVNENFFTSTDSVFVTIHMNGAGGNDVLLGGLAADVLDGGAGSDTLTGNEANDTITAQDGEADTVTCGNGTDDATVDADPTDTVDASCETVHRPAGGGGGGTTGGSTGVATGGTPGGTTGGTGGGTSGGTSAAVNIGGVAYTGVVTDTLHAVPFPELRGLGFLAAGNRLGTSGINFEYSKAAMRYGRPDRLVSGVRPIDGSWKEGDVLAASYKIGPNVFTVPGQPVSTGDATKVIVALTIYGGPERDTCVQDARDNAGLPWDDFQALMTARGCRFDDVDVLFARSTSSRGETDLNSGDRCEAATKAAVAGRNKVDEGIIVPSNPDLQDLRLFALESAQGASLQAGTFTLQASDGFEFFRIFVGDRTVSQIPNGAQVFVDAVGVGDDTYVGITGAHDSPGVATFRVRPRHAGLIDVAAVWQDSAGQMICGGTQLRVTGRTAREGQSISTVTGRVWKYDAGSRVWRRHGSAAARIQGRHAALEGGNWLQQAGQWLHDVLFGIPAPVQQQQAAVAARGSASSLQQLDASSQAAQLGHFQVGTSSVLGGLAAAVDATAFSGSIILADGNKVVVVSGIVAQGGGNLKPGEVKIISNDGASFTGVYIPGVGIVAQGGGNIVAQGGGNLLSENGLGIVAQGGGNIVAQGGGNIISTNGGGIISTNGSGIVAQGGGNAVGGGPGAIQAGIVAQGGGN